MVEAFFSNRGLIGEIRQNSEEASGVKGERSDLGSDVVEVLLIVENLSFTDVKSSKARGRWARVRDSAVRGEAQNLDVGTQRKVVGRRDDSAPGRERMLKWNWRAWDPVDEGKQGATPHSREAAGNPRLRRLGHLLHRRGDQPSGPGGSVPKPSEGRAWRAAAVRRPSREDRSRSRGRRRARLTHVERVRNDGAGSVIQTQTNSGS